MNGPCSIPAPRCGYVGPGVAGHHWLGLDEDGEYAQPEILLALCQRLPGGDRDDCHQGGIHRVLQAQRLDGPMPATPGVIVGRIAVTFGYLAMQRVGNVTLPASMVAEVADVLARIGYELRRGER